MAKSLFFIQMRLRSFLIETTIRIKISIKWQTIKAYNQRMMKSIKALSRLMINATTIKSKTISSCVSP